MVFPLSVVPLFPEPVVDPVPEPLADPSEAVPGPMVVPLELVPLCGPAEPLPDGAIAPSASPEPDWSVEPSVAPALLPSVSELISGAVMAPSSAGTASLSLCVVPLPGAVLQAASKARAGRQKIGKRVMIFSISRLQKADANRSRLFRLARRDACRIDAG